jgi:trimeric autotransporter adhesin
MIIGTGIGISFSKGGGAAAPNPNFISTWDTTKAGSASDTIVLPMTAGNTVHWGDGSSDTTNTHTYASSGTYTVTIEGAVTTFRFSNSGDRRKIVDISNWGGFDVSNNAIFMGCENMYVSALDAPIISATNLVNTFRFCDSLADSNFNAWDVSSVSVMSYLFNDCKNINVYIGDWDVSSVTDMLNVFETSTGFSRNLNDWDVSNVTNFTSFTLGGSFNGNISDWDVSSVTNMSGMFRNNTAFNQDLSAWVTTSLVIMDNIFYQASSYNSPMNNWDVSGVSNFQNVFAFASSFNQPIGNWDMASSATRVDYMLRDADAFDQDISSWVVTSITNLGNFMVSATGLSTANYDALLIAWDAQGAMSYSGTVNFGGSKYTSGGAAEAARTSLISKWGGITDGGAA